MDPAMLHALGVGDGDEVLVRMRVVSRSPRGVKVELPRPRGQLGANDEIANEAVVAIIKTARAARAFAAGRGLAEPPGR